MQNGIVQGAAGANPTGAFTKVSSLISYADPTADFSQASGSSSNSGGIACDTLILVVEQTYPYTFG